MLANSSLKPCQNAATACLAHYQCAADRLTVADLKVFVWIRHLRSGVLDHVPADLPDRVAPKLVEHYERVKNDPRVQAYYAKHGVSG